MTGIRWCLTATLLLAWTCTLSAQALRPGRLSKEEQVALRPGLRLALFTPEDLQQPHDMRSMRVAALHVPAGKAASPFVSPGPFVATASGYLKLPLKGEYAFHIQTSQPLTLKINGVTVYQAAKPGVTPRIALVKGYNAIEVTITASGKQTAMFRLGWSGDGFVEEPLPADALFVRGDETLLAHGSALRSGRELFATHSCAKCHTVGESLRLAPHATAMPELGFTAPSLDGVGSRLNEGWLRAWVRDPHSLRPTATMPAVLTGDEAQQVQGAADIAAYLMTLIAPEPPTAAATTETHIDAGLKLFENLGCVGCHSIKPLAEEDPFARQSLHYAQAKFTPGGLTAFLKSPHEHYAWSRMPDFKLSEEEAVALSAFLSSRASGKVETAQDSPAGNAERGRALFASAGCASCHSTGLKEPLKAPSVVLNTKVDARGCLAEKHSGRSPDFHFTPAEREALQTFLATDRKSLLVDTPAEFAQRQVTTLTCVACHRRDGANSVLSSVLQEEGEQGLTPEVLPLLTWTGEKLKPAWSEKLIAGHLDQRARPWLRARMPAFPARAKLLAIGLSHEHGFAIDENPALAHDPALAKVGQQLAGDTNGFSCIKCHAIGQQPPLAPFEAPGINLVSASERLRYTYYPRWMMDPPRVDVLTKMPKFAADGKTTGVRNVLEGDAQRQYEALWHYIQTLSPPAMR